MGPCNTGSPSGESWYLLWEPSFVKVLMRLARPGMVVYDVGAEEAEFSVLVAQIVGGENMHLFEPQPGVWPNILGMWQANELAEPAGCWPGFLVDQSSAGSLVQIRAGWPPQVNGPLWEVPAFLTCNAHPTIPAISLDDYARATCTYPDIVMMDVEGAETLVVGGMRRTLREQRPYVFVSVHRYGDGYQDRYNTQQEWLFRWFSQAGYTGRFLGEGHEAHWFFHHRSVVPELARVPAAWQGIDEYLRSKGTLTDAELAQVLAKQYPVTVLMPTSPIPSHPSTEMIEDSIRKIRAYPELARAEIIIMVDGVREEQLDWVPAYEEYKRRLVELCDWDPDFEGCFPLIFEEHTHQANMMRRALEMVRTPHVFFCEHDTWPCGDIPWPNLFEALKEERVNSIRLFMRDGIDPMWGYLFDDEAQVVAGAPLTRTRQWSGRPHLARTEWYRRLIEKFFEPDVRAFVESTMICTADCPWEDFCLWVYTPSGDPRSVGVSRCGHSDGRAGGPRYLP